MPVPALYGDGQFVRVTHVGIDTEYGKIGADIAGAPTCSTPLERQVAHLIKICSVISFILCVCVTAITWLRLDSFIQAVLSGVTIAMATIPEEFPVVLTVFLAMGAWRLAKKNALVRRMSAVETLGAVTVLCVDKTGTLTENRMCLSGLLPVEGYDENELLLLAVAASNILRLIPWKRRFWKRQRNRVCHWRRMIF